MLRTTDAGRRRKISKHVSYVLRHRPESAGLELDARGFAPIDRGVLAASHHLGMAVTRQDLEALAEPGVGRRKRRFEIEGDAIRAGHGHSIAIAEYQAVQPHAPLYHGAPTAAIAPRIVLADDIPPEALALAAPEGTPGAAGERPNVLTPRGGE